MHHVTIFLFLLPGILFGPDSQPTTQQTIQVTATKVSEEVNQVPVALTVINAEDLLHNHADTLDKALSLVSGVAAHPGGDSGPAGTVPEFWGLREFDAFLLVVDGVPWGGAFNPALTSLSLENVERIEVLRGPAPVMYGATSFVGVIHVIHNRPQSTENGFKVHGGSFSSGGATANVHLPNTGAVQHALTLNADSRGFEDDRTKSEQGHLMYRMESLVGSGSLHLDADIHFLRQDPASPHPRQGTRLTDLVARDSNFNPSDARLDQDRFHLALGFETSMANGAFGTTLSLTHSTQDNLRGFLGELDGEAPNASGYTQDVTLDDYYFDAHWSRQLNRVHLLVGGDFLAGKGEQSSHNFRYYVPLDASSIPSSAEGIPLEDTEMDDERSFGGLYVQTEWMPNDRLRFDIGTRFNFTHEKREGEAEPFGEEEEDPGEEAGSDSKSISRLSGVFGASYQMAQTKNGSLWAFADYRNTFKPAALDFGPEGEHEILEPETAESYELGVKWQGSGNQLMVSAFSQDFNNLVVSQRVNGFPQLVNAGKERFRGVEAEGRLKLTQAVRCDLGYSYHDAKFRDYERLFDGVPTQLSGNYLELAARHMGSVALGYFKTEGFSVQVQGNYVGSRFLDKRNRAEAGDYITCSAAVGYHHHQWEVRLEGNNLTNRRDPVAESELGDAQYYLNPARSFRLSLSSRF